MTLAAAECTEATYTHTCEEYLICITLRVPSGYTRTCPLNNTPCYSTTNIMGHVRSHLHPLLQRTCLVGSLCPRLMTRWPSRPPRIVPNKQVKPQRRRCQVRVCVSLFVCSHVYVHLCVHACVCEHISINTSPYLLDPYVYVDADAGCASPAAIVPDAPARTTQPGLCRGCATKIPADVKFCGWCVHVCVSIQGIEDP